MIRYEKLISTDPQFNSNHCEVEFLAATWPSSPPEKMAQDDIWWFMMIYDELWWFMMIYDYLWWYMMVYDDIRWFMMIYIWDDLPWSTFSTPWFSIAPADLCGSPAWAIATRHPTPSRWGAGVTASAEGWWCSSSLDLNGILMGFSWD